MAEELVDIGANLAHDSFDDDRDDVIRRAKQVGVRTIIVTGSSDDSNIAALDLANQHPGRIYSTAGVHPHHASDYDKNSDAIIRKCIAQDRCVAVGECGLDYYRDLSPRAAQQDAFKAQLDIAAGSGHPVFLHQRDAHDDFVEILEPMLPKLSRAVAHCFTGDAESLRALVALGLYIGITGWVCDERRGAELKNDVALIPDDRLMIETDAPYLLPRTIRPRPESRRNEPAYLPEVLATIAAARGQTEPHVAAMTTANAKRFFGVD